MRKEFDWWRKVVKSGSSWGYLDNIRVDQDVITITPCDTEWKSLQSNTVDRRSVLKNFEKEQMVISCCHSHLVESNSDFGITIADRVDVN